VTVVALVAGWAAAGRAANIVQNPGFEADTITLSNPTVSPPTDWTATGNVGVDSAFPNSGNNDAFIGTGTLSQTLTTAIGTSYTISFFVSVNDFNLFADPSATFDATFGGVDLLSGGISPEFVAFGAYTEFSDTVVASSVSTEFSFTGVTNSPDGPWYLDDVDVEAQSSEVPEPSGALLLLLAIVSLVIVRRRMA
jgi:hypothetical protein